jgi:hypothetical protein
MSDASIDVIGKHVSELPGAIPDVWPIIDASGTVVEVVRTWDDGHYVRLDHRGAPVDGIGQTHHLISRPAYQETMLPREWAFVGAHRVSRGLSKVECRYGTPQDGADAIGDARELEVLTEINAGVGTLMDEIDTFPPFTHVLEFRGEFFLVQRRSASAAAGEAALPDAPDAATTEAPHEAAAATGAHRRGAADGRERGTSDHEAGGHRAGERRAVDLLKSITTPDDDDDGELALPRVSPDVGLRSSLDESIWEPDTAPDPSIVATGSGRPATTAAPMLPCETPGDEDSESMHAAARGQASRPA